MLNPKARLPTVSIARYLEGVESDPIFLCFEWRFGLFRSAPPYLIVVLVVLLQIFYKALCVDAFNKDEENIATMEAHVKLTVKYVNLRHFEWTLLWNSSQHKIGSDSSMTFWRRWTMKPNV